MSNYSDDRLRFLAASLKDSDNYRNVAGLAAELLACRADRDRLAAALADALARVYASAAPADVAVAVVCDEHLDRSGQLLGEVRDRAAALGGRAP